MAGDRANRTEQPTARRLEKAREKGNVPRTKELSGALTLLAFLVFCNLFGGAWFGRLTGMMAVSLSSVVRPDLGVNDVVVLAGSMGQSLLMLLAAPLAMVAFAGIGGNVVQGPPPLTLKPLKPDLSKLNPISGVKKVFKIKSWFELLKTLFKMSLITAIAVTAVRQAMTEGLPGAPGAEGTLAVLFALGGKVILRVALAVLALSVIDLLFTRYDYTRNLKMTKQEVKDERKQQEGDPLVRARIRSKQLSLARTRMMADVAKATVVVTNPTHYAVALRYVPGETQVPEVLAKGQAKLAARIREAATEHGIPIVSDPPLARALYRAVPVGGVIPHKLFRAVAEVLALVLRPGERRRTTSDVLGDN